MNTGLTPASYLVLAVALVLSPDAMAVKVYQWTDAEGIVHFSDTPPQDEAPPAVNEIVLFDYPENETNADEYSIVNQLERMTAWRRQAEEDRRAWKQLQLEEERLAQEQQAYQPVAEVGTDTYYPVVYSPYTYYPRSYNYPYSGHSRPYMNRHGRHFSDKHFGAGRMAFPEQFTTGYYKLR